MPNVGKTIKLHFPKLLLLVLHECGSLFKLWSNPKLAIWGWYLPRILHCCPAGLATGSGHCWLKLHLTKCWKGQNICVRKERVPDLSERWYLFPLSLHFSHSFSLVFFLSLSLALLTSHQPAVEIQSHFEHASIETALDVSPVAKQERVSCCLYFQCDSFTVSCYAVPFYANALVTVYFRSDVGICFASAPF